MNTKKTFDTHKLVLLALFTAIVIILQILAIVTRPLFPAFAITLVLIPIVIGSALIGTMAGCWLGLAFGLAVLISGDAAWFMSINPIGAVLTVLLKGALAGLASGAAYRLLAKISKTFAAIAAAAICPIVNTGIFVVGAYLFFLPEITQWGETLGFSSGAAAIFIGLIGVNLIVELGINLILSPAIVRLIQHGQEKKALG